MLLKKFASLLWRLVDWMQLACGFERSGQQLALICYITIYYKSLRRRPWRKTHRLRQDFRVIVLILSDNQQRHCLLAHCTPLFNHFWSRSIHIKRIKTLRSHLIGQLNGWNMLLLAWSKHWATNPCASYIERSCKADLFVNRGCRSQGRTREARKNLRHQSGADRGGVFGERKLFQGHDSFFMTYISCSWLKPDLLFF